MCGIVGYVGDEECASILLDGLRRLEYRGYDSAGLAIHHGGEIGVVRAVGKLRNLEKALNDKPLAGTVGIGHTRWATHGRPSEVNAHPHVARGVAVVHNGIIENHLPLRKRLESEGHTIVSDTDTEIVAHLVSLELEKGGELEMAVRRALAGVEGAYAIAVMSQKEPDTHRRRQEQLPAGPGRDRRSRLLRKRHPRPAPLHARHDLPRGRGDGGAPQARASPSAVSTARSSSARRSTSTGRR